MPARPGNGQPAARARGSGAGPLDEAAFSRPIGAFRATGADGNIWVNDRYLEITGLGPDRALGFGWLEVVHPDDRHAVLGSITDLRDRPREELLEHRILRHDGEVRRVQTRFVPLAGTSGDCTGFVGSIEDVSTEQQTKDRAEQLRAACEDSADLVALTRTGVSLQARTGPGLLYLNAAGRAMIGIGPDDDVSGVYLADFVDATSTEAIEQEVRPALLTTGRWSGGLTLVTGDGRKLPMSVALTLHTGRDGALSYVSVVARDLSALVDVEQRLTESEAWFRSLVQNSSELVVVWDRDLRITYVSPSVERVLGYPPEEVLGCSFDELALFSAELVHPDDDGLVTEKLREMLATRREIAPTVHRVRHADGSWRVLKSSLTDLIDDPVVQGIVVNSHDVTDSWAAEEARSRSETALRAIVRSAPVAIAAVDRSANVVLWNPAAEELFGWKEGEVLGGPLPTVPDDPVSRGVFEEIHARVLAGETVRGLELERRRRDDSLVETALSVAPIRDATGEVTSALELLHDVTAQKDAERARFAAEAEVRASEQRFRSLAEHSSDFVLVYGPDGRIAYMNPPAARFTGLEVGDPTPPLHVPEDARRVDEWFRQIVAGPRAVVSEPIEVRLRRQDGELRWMELIATNLLDDELVQGVVVNARDVTDRREADEALRESEERFRALVQNLSEGITILGADGTLRYSSPAAREMLGYEGDAGYGGDPLAFVHPDDRDAIAEVMTRAFSEPGVHGPVTLRVEAADSSWRYLEALGSNLLHDPIIDGVLITARDVTERVVTEEALRQSDDRFRALVQNLSDVITVVGPEGRLVYSSPAAERLFGFEYGDESWMDPIARVHPDDAERVVEQFGAQLAGEHARPVSFRLRVADDTYREVEAIAADMSDVPAVGGIVVTTRDVSDRARAESLVTDQARVLRLIAQGAPLEDTLATMCEVVEAQVPGSWCSIMLLDAAAGVLRAAAGPNLPPVVARGVTEVAIGPDSVACGDAAFRRAPVVVPDVMTDPNHVAVRPLAEEAGIRGIWSTPVLASSGDQVLGTFAVYFSEVRGPSSRDREVVDMIARLVAIAVERQASEDRLAHEAQHDHLTGLPNRALFVEFLTLAQARARRRSSGVAVLFLDLDRFKNVNDSLGHDAGDALLVKLADRLRAVLRPGDTVARFGGDEFTVLCDDLPSEDPRAEVTEVARRLLEVIEQPIEIHGEEVHLSASIGIAIASAHDQSEELLRDADAAMYRAKELGKGRWEVFDEEMRSHVLRRLETESALHRALQNDELRLHFQPVVDVVSSSCIGAEALVRWQHPERGLVGPVEFIDLAEETGLIVPLGEWVLDQACRAISRWRFELQLVNPFTVSVNLSARQVAQGDLVARVAAALERTGAPAEMLCLEITESVLMQVASVETLRELKALGVRLSIDDFGTGYSSLGYLKRFPVDIVKVDRSFVDGLGTDPEDSAIVAAVVSLGQALGLRVVAEGVETDRQLGELARLGCDQAQGFLFSVPLPGVDFERGLRSGGGHWRLAG